MRVPVLGLASVLCAFAAVHCNGSTVPLGGGAQQDATTATATPDGGGISDPVVGPGGDSPIFEDPGIPTISSSNKVDILLVVDDSASMAIKGEYFARSLDKLVKSVSAVTSDMHLGVISTSLDNGGGDICDTSKASLAHLRTKDKDGAVVAPGGVLTLRAPSETTSFVQNAEKLVRGVGQAGCGLEAQLESAYRFLVQPDPYQTVTKDAFQMAQVEGVDLDLLRERAAFLRPDSLVVVLMVTDEDDSHTDPLSVGGFGYAFASRQFPGSRIARGAQSQGTTAPRGTSICATNPGSEDCTSCGFAASCDPSTESCQKIKTDPSCTASGVEGKSGAGYDGYHPPNDDDLNVRFHRMKERFGIDPQYPIDRYVAGFGSSRGPDREGEHATTMSASGQRLVANYTHRNRCTNPLFAQNLPTEAGDEVCNLPRGPRTPEMVVFGLLAGVPPQLVDSTSPNWAFILGTDPEKFDFAGIDAHMVASVEPRSPLLSGGDSDAPRGDNGSDPIHGREWNTQKRDLQYACTFALPAPVSCTTPDSCECGNDPTNPSVPATNSPLCSNDPKGVQIRAKAYPSTRELLLAKKLGTRAIVGSVCAAPGETNYDGFMARVEGLILPRVKP